MKKPVKRCLVCDEPIPTEDVRCCVECEPSMNETDRQWGEYEFIIKVHGGGWTKEQAWDDAMKILNNRVHSSYFPPSDTYEVNYIEIDAREEEE
jgi:predicted nucleic acid-binding Zn ribbon protein